jgi:uncharacterized protein
MKSEKKKNRFKSYLRLLLWVLLVQLLLINISAAIYAYKFTHFYTDPALRNYRPEHRNIFVKTWKLFTGPTFPKSLVEERPTFQYDTVTLHTSSGIVIDGWYGKVDSAKGTVIIFHGLSANKGELLTEAYEFRYLGYNVFMIDLRAHGNSGGRVTTLGYKESEEVKLAYNFIKAKGEQKIVLFGISMGAVILPKAIVDYDIQPAGIIMEMPFASLQDHLEARARVLGFPDQPFAFLVTLWIGIEKGFNGFRYKTNRYTSQLHTPVLLQWGAKDDYVLKHETDEIFESITSREKKLSVFPNAGHESLLQNDAERWQQDVTGFLNSVH